MRLQFPEQVDYCLAGNCKPVELLGPYSIVIIRFLKCVHNWNHFCLHGHTGK